MGLRRCRRPATSRPTGDVRQAEGAGKAGLFGERLGVIVLRDIAQGLTGAEARIQQGVNGGYLHVVEHRPPAALRNGRDDQLDLTRFRNLENPRTSGKLEIIGPPQFAERALDNTFVVEVERTGRLAANPNTKRQRQEAVIIAATGGLKIDA